jgi:hypothetical protein
MEAMHDAEMTKLSSMGLNSQIAKLDKRFAVAHPS